MNNLIVIKNLVKQYNSHKKIKILNKINFSFKKGKIYSLVGPSGSGKSTLLNLLSLIDRPSSGHIKIANKNINFSDASINDELRANKIGIIYQDNNLLPDFNALENVYLARLAIDNNKNKAIEDSKKIIKNLKLYKRLEHFPSELSGGEIQRIAIARALINSPEIILADEPTGSLDQSTSKEIFNLFLKFKSQNRSIIYATHNRELADKADYKLKIIDGNIRRLNE